jgi:hypothetical protein
VERAAEHRYTLEMENNVGKNSNDASGNEDVTVYLILTWMGPFAFVLCLVAGFLLGNPHFGAPWVADIFWPLGVLSLIIAAIGGAYGFRKDSTHKVALWWGFVVNALIIAAVIVFVAWSRESHR